MPGDDEEDGLDDLEDEFEMDKQDLQGTPDQMMHGRMNYGSMYEHEVATHNMSMHQQPRYPLLTDGRAGDSEDDDTHALVVPTGHVNYNIDSKLPGNATIRTTPLGNHFLAIMENCRN